MTGLIKAASQKLDQRIPVMMSGEDVKAIDEWRRHQEDLPNRSEAVRRLVAMALKAK
ncbi:MAG: hypothetical protein M9932_01750 [Xanthobacteraceae bacterium]|nr:hypothetical protein [Xanthobacteraceae bacterium]